MHSKTIRTASFAAVLVLASSPYAAANPASVPVPGASPAGAVAANAAAYDCEGTACAQVVLTLDAEKGQFKAQNNSDRPVRVEMFNWAGGASVVVAPGKFEHIAMKSFDGPFRANFE